MGIYNLRDLRSAAGAFGEGLSDEALINDYASRAGMDPVHVANTLGYDGGATTINRERISSSIDNYQAELYETVGTGAHTLGLQGATDWATRNASDNRFQADVASQRAQTLGGVQSWIDVHGVADTGSYLLSQGVQVSPWLTSILLLVMLFRQPRARMASFFRHRKQLAAHKPERLSGDNLTGVGGWLLALCIRRCPDHS